MLLVHQRIKPTICTYLTFAYLFCLIVTTPCVLTEKEINTFNQDLMCLMNQNGYKHRKNYLLSSYLLNSHWKNLR